MAYIVIENGALQGQKFDINDAVTIGRHSSCDVVLPIPGISRQHCKVLRVNNTYVVEDLESRNGTYLNGAPVRNSPLSNGDVLNVSRFIMRFVDPAAAQENHPPGSRTVSVTSVVIDDTAARANIGEEMSLDATCYPSVRAAVSKTTTVPTHSDDTVVQPDEIVRELQKRLDIFYEVSSCLTSATEEDELLAVICKCMLDIYPQADRAFIATGSDVDNLEVRNQLFRDARPDSDAPVCLSRSVVQDVLKRREALLISDMSADENYAHAESIISQNLCSIMCAPLISHGHIHGIIQIENNSFVSPFDADDLNLLVGVAVQAALFLSNSLLTTRFAEEKSRRSHLQRFFSPAVAKEVMNNNLQLGGELKDGCIMFCDIVGYTARSENVDAAVVIRDLNQYFGVMVGIILAEKGTIDKFGGDAIMAVWGAPVAVENDAHYAISCALKMQNAVVRFNQSLTAQGTPPVSMGIGLHCGEFVAGNIGSEERMEYTVIGDHVNTAARVESKAVGGMVLISDAMLKRVGQDVILGTTLAPVPLKGISEPIALTSVRGIRSDDGLMLSIPAVINGVSGKITFCDDTRSAFKFVGSRSLDAGRGTLVLALPEYEDSRVYRVFLAESGDDAFCDFRFETVPDVIAAMLNNHILAEGQTICWQRS